jgi:hypothetical protein
MPCSNTTTDGCPDECAVTGTDLVSDTSANYTGVHPIPHQNADCSYQCSNPKPNYTSNKADFTTNRLSSSLPK